MKKLILIFLLVLNSLAQAAWIEVGSTTSGKFLILYDPDSINRVQNIATIKILKNFKDSRKSVDPQKLYSFLSQVSIQEINCTWRRYRHKEISMWSNLNGAGRLEQTHKYSEQKEWGEPVKVNSIQNALIDIACTQ